ncbi:MAG: hypothetical protein ACLU30_07890 [Odoribacter splanchnicus]|jgi:hypothetical protein
MIRGYIESDRVRTAVYNRINFDLSENIWTEINCAFGYYWNEKIGFAGDVYSEQIVDYIEGCLKEKHIILQKGKIIYIVNVILEYIKMIGGFLNEETPFIPLIKG